MNIRNFSNIKSLLFENKTIKQTILKNTFWLTIAEGTTRLLKLILIIYVARILGATQYGIFTFALAFVSLFVVFSNFGLTQITTRELSREKKREEDFPAIFTLKILLSIGALILILIGSFFVTSSSVTRGVIWILAVYILINNLSEIIYAFLRARQQMQYEAFVKILQAITVTGIGFFVILNFPSVINLSYSYLFASLISLILVLLFFHFKIFSLKISFKKSIQKQFLAMSWPLGLTAVFSTIYNQIDSVMMGYWGQIIETGWYNAAYRIVYVTLILSALISNSFYPVLSIAFKESKKRLQQVWNYRMGIVILIVTPLLIGGMVLAPRIINFVYGTAFQPSILAFRILMVMGGIMFLITALAHVLIVSNQQRKILWIGIFGAVTNIILNLILIPKYSLYGAAVATLITMFLMFILYFISVIKFTSVRPLNLKIFLFSFDAVLSVVPMYLVISHPLIYNVNILFTILVGFIIYLISLFAFNKIFKFQLIPHNTLDF